MDRNVGESLLSRLSYPPVYVGRLTLLLLTVLSTIFIQPFRGKKSIRRDATVVQMVEIGIRTMPILFLIVFLVGLILAMQTAGQLRQFGTLHLVPGLVGVAIIKEFGPLLTAIVVAARVGAAITAELGTMVISEEVMALETMALRPVQFLVVPRFVALVCCVPALTILADIVGMGGGFVLGITDLNLFPVEYVHNSLQYVELSDVIQGFAKSLAFGAVIALISCYEGLNVGGGADSVGLATTKSVVASILFIMLTDLAFTTIFY